MDILSTSSYQQDLRNLLPWGLESVDSDGNYNSKTIILSLYEGDQQDRYVEVQFLSCSIIAVSSSHKSGIRIYHPTNFETLNDLMEYVQINGVKQ